MVDMVYIQTALKHARKESVEYSFACTVVGAVERAGYVPNGTDRTERHEQAMELVGRVVEIIERFKLAEVQKA